jgi:hypothetical protein
MTWFKIDDGFWSHPKVLELSDEAVALWVRAGSYCAGHLTDGEVKRATLRILGAQQDAATELVLAGLWDLTGDTWSFHDWDQYQPTKDQVLADRAAATERKRKSRGVSRRDSHSDTAVSHTVSHASPSRPVPTRPLTDYVSQSGDDRQTEQQSAAIIQGLGIDPSKLRTHIEAKAGTTASATEAMRIATEILARGGDITHPQRYVLSSITKNPDEIRTSLRATRPASRPEREPECDIHAGYPLPCHRCAQEQATP